MSGRFRAGLFVPALLVTLAAGCSRPVDLTAAVEVADVTTGWYDAGVVDGKNKLVPSATFRIRQTDPDAGLRGLALNITFRIAGDEENFEDVFVQRVDFGPDNQTEPITVRTENGYTGDPPQSRADMLKNTYFRDMELRIFGRQSSAQWTELRRVTIDRQIITR